MALSSSIVWETRASGASDNNGGGFKAGATGTDRSQQNSAQVVIDNSTITTSITTNVITFTGGYTATSANSPTRLIGYSSARGDSGHATLTLQTNTGLTGISATGSGFWMEQVDVDCGSLGTSTGVNLAGASSQCRNCKISNFTTRGLLSGSSATEATDLQLTGGRSAATPAIDNSANRIVR